MPEMNDAMKVATSLLDSIRTMEWTEKRLWEYNEHLKSINKRQSETEILLRQVSNLVECLVEPWVKEWKNLTPLAQRLIIAQDQVKGRCRDLSTGRVLEREGNDAKRRAGYGL